MLEWIKSRWRTLRRREITYRVRHLDDPPVDSEAGVLYVVGDEGHYWLAVLRCPCGCGAEIQLPLSGRNSPRWKFDGNANSPTLTPSIWRNVGCKSHFFVRRGRVVWS